MEIVKFKREQEKHLSHINRIRNMTPMLDCTKPESLGLKHLATRPKKMQLMEDRRQHVAKDNAKLMSLMTDVSLRPINRIIPASSIIVLIFFSVHFPFTFRS